MNTKPVITIDCNYLFPGFAASFLLIDGGRVAIIETGTRFSVPSILKGLEACGRTPADVAFIIITHVHLDHSGGTAELLDACPHATVLAHSRAARHLIDPSRLIAGATEVYGRERFERLYGLIKPIDEGRVRIVQDRERIRFGSRELLCIYTLGHSKHHMCLFDTGSESIFTGDSFGLGYPCLQSGTTPFFFPTTSPPDFDPVEARKTIETILATGAKRAFLTHYGEVGDIRGAAEILGDTLSCMEDILAKAVSISDGKSREDFCIESMETFIREQLAKRDVPLTRELHDFLTIDIQLNAQGIAYAAIPKR